jgi:hypothetical protein
VANREKPSGASSAAARNALREDGKEQTEIGCAEIGLTEICPADVSIPEDRSAEIGPMEVRTTKIGPAEVAAIEDRVGEVRPAEVRFAEIRSAEQSPRKVRAVQVRFAQMDGFASRQAPQAAFPWRSRKTWSVSVIARLRSDNPSKLIKDRRRRTKALGSAGSRRWGPPPEGEA